MGETSNLRIEEITMRVCGFDRRENQLASLGSLDLVQPWPIAAEANVGVEDSKNFNYGCKVGPLPYRFQQNYDRNRGLKQVKVAVLENEILKATFLLDFGGRLWSLYHKVEKRELLYRNPVVQLANLAFRNAWFSGGVEWNMSVPAHNPFTCSAPFFAKLSDSDGTPILRMYEFERIRKIPFQVDFYLPAGSPVLLVRTRLVNCDDEEKPAYWWSNIAVAETPGTRVLSPCEEAFYFVYSPGRNSVKKIPIPEYQGTDVTYSLNSRYSHDYFFRVNDNSIPWVAVADEEGKGLVQFSTKFMKGRKLFVWGSEAGRKWQRFLTEGDNPYIEVQAGIGRTQVECLPMPAGAKWSWIEAYGLLESDAEIVHGKDWQKARSHVEEQIIRLKPAGWLEKELERSSYLLDVTPETIIQSGSGWGALEEKRRKKAGLAGFEEFGMLFDESSLTSEQEPWLGLLESGEFDSRCSSEGPGGFMIQEEWREMLIDSVNSGKSGGWYGWYHLGVMYYGSENYDAACEAWEKSISIKPSFWGFRDLAFLHGKLGDAEKAVEYYKLALALDNTVADVYLEYGKLLVGLGRFDELGVMLSGLCDEIRGMARIQLLVAEYKIEKGDLDSAQEIIETVEVADLRESERTLTDLWYRVVCRKQAAKEGRELDESLLQEVRANIRPPVNIDFRMSFSAELGSEI
jgi:hypothetical protein